MEADDAHTLQNRFLDAVDYLVGHAVVAHMSPPDKHVGIVEDLLSKAAFLVVERCGADGNIVAFKEIGDGLVNALGVDGSYLFVILFVVKFVPDGYLYHIVAPLLLLTPRFYHINKTLSSATLLENA
jgi:hypothetical protein